MNAVNTLPWTASNAPTAKDVQQRLEALLVDLRAVELSTAPDADMAPLVLSLKAAADHIQLVHAEIENRVLKLGKQLPGVAVGDAVVHRRWSDVAAATSLAAETLGDKAFSTPALLSPAQIEKLGPDGKAFVALCSEKPPAPKKVVY